MHVARTVRMRLVLILAVLGACVWVAGAPAQEPPPTEPPPPEQADNPCLGELAAQLRCPDLVMRRPWGLSTDRLTRRGHTVLRAGNVIDNIGAGPAELHGLRLGSEFMRGRQRIYVRGGGRIGVSTGALLQFKFAHLERFWWKFYEAARFELWRLDADGVMVRLVRTGPKVAYCLRDLARTRPELTRSPRKPVYPACSNNPNADRITLGTSTGWADIYPPTYPEQWIDVTGLRGCFAYVQIADPENGIFESDEENNQAQAVVRLPFRKRSPRGDCPGTELGRPYRSGPFTD